MVELDNVLSDPDISTVMNLPKDNNIFVKGVIKSYYLLTVTLKYHFCLIIKNG